jgi:WhiB family redox-sensing transcriptional regulator
VDAARRICADCPVKAPCLEYALANRIDHGVWGGTSERERRRILRKRRIEAGSRSIAGNYS